MRGVTLLIVILASFASGCSSYLAPTLQLADVQIDDLTDEAMQLHFVLELSNPNVEPLSLREFVYELSVDGVPTYQGKWAARSTLTGEAVRRQSLPAVVPFAAAGWSAKTPPERFDYRLTGTVLYLAPGEIAEILLDTGLRRPHLDFAVGGEVRLREPRAEARPAGPSE